MTSGVTLPTKIRHPCLTKMSINKSRLNQNTRTIRRILRFTDQIWSREEQTQAEATDKGREVRSSRIQLDQAMEREVWRMMHNLQDKLIKKSQGVHGPICKKPMKIRRNPMSPRIRRGNRTSGERDEQPHANDSIKHQP